MFTQHIIGKLYNYKGILKVRVISSSEYDVNRKTNIEYVLLDGKVAKMHAVTNLIGGAAKVGDKKLSRTIEGSIRELLYVDDAERKCREGIWGKPDFIKDGIPGEIKSFSRRVKLYVLEKGIYQAGVYAWLYNVRYAYLVVGVYEPINDVEVIIKSIYEFKLQLEYINEEKLRNEVNKIIEKPEEVMVIDEAQS